jgi:aconitate hydratase
VDYAPPARGAASFDNRVYERRVYNGWGKPRPELALRYGPNIAAWPPIPPLSEHLLIELASVIHDEVTTTDELIPSGETSSFRSNPIRLAEFTLSRRDPGYVGGQRKPRKRRQTRRGSRSGAAGRPEAGGRRPGRVRTTHIGSAVFAKRPGDGSAREQAASCQRVLGGAPTSVMNTPRNATAPTALTGECCLSRSTKTFLRLSGRRQDICARCAPPVERGAAEYPAAVITKEAVVPLTLHIADLTEEEKKISGRLPDELLRRPEKDNTKDNEHG